MPGRQRFIHNPIHPSRSISPLVGPCSTEQFGTSASCSQFFWLVLILDCTLARVYYHSWIQLICHPFLLCSFSFFPFLFQEYISCPYIIPPFPPRQLPKIDQNMTPNTSRAPPGIRKSGTMSHLPFQHIPEGTIIEPSGLPIIGSLCLLSGLAPY